jgi:hypothetical protein
MLVFVFYFYCFWIEVVCIYIFWILDRFLVSAFNVGPGFISISCIILRRFGLVCCGFCVRLFVVVCLFVFCWDFSSGCLDVF